MTTTIARSVLVTGASSGIGNHTVRYLAERGYRVYGPVRKDRGVDELGRIENATPLMVDVTNPQQIQDAVGFITKGAGARPLRPRQQRWARRPGDGLSGEAGSLGVAAQLLHRCGSRLQVLP